MKRVFFAARNVPSQIQNIFRYFGEKIIAKFGSGKIFFGVSSISEKVRNFANAWGELFWVQCREDVVNKNFVALAQRNLRSKLIAVFAQSSALFF